VLDSITDILKNITNGGNALHSYDASNGWTIHPDSAFLVFDKKNPHSTNDLEAIIVACDEAITKGYGEWAEPLKIEASNYLQGEK